MCGGLHRGAQVLTLLSEAVNTGGSPIDSLARIWEALGGVWEALGGSGPGRSLGGVWEESGRNLGGVCGRSLGGAWEESGRAWEEPGRAWEVLEESVGASDS